MKDFIGFDDEVKRKLIRLGSNPPDKKDCGDEDEDEDEEVEGDPSASADSLKGSIYFQWNMMHEGKAPKKPHHSTTDIASYLTDLLSRPPFVQELQSCKLPGCKKTMVVFFFLLDAGASNPFFFLTRASSSYPLFPIIPISTQTVREWVQALQAEIPFQDEILEELVRRGEGVGAARDRTATQMFVEKFRKQWDKAAREQREKGGQEVAAAGGDGGGATERRRTRGGTAAAAAAAAAASGGGGGAP
jgi:hypothetical protein